MEYTYMYFFWKGQFYGNKNRICGLNSPGLMQTPVEPFMQPGVREIYKNILLSTLLSLLALAKGKVLAPKKPHRRTKNPQGQMS